MHWQEEFNKGKEWKLYEYVTRHLAQSLGDGKNQWITRDIIYIYIYIYMYIYPSGNFT